MQTWENEPDSAKRPRLWECERVNSSDRKLWWFREGELVSHLSPQEFFEMPFLTQHYFHNYLSLLSEACVSDFIRNHSGTWVKNTDTLELDQWTSQLVHMDLRTNE